MQGRPYFHFNESLSVLILKKESRTSRMHNWRRRQEWQATGVEPGIDEVTLSGLALDAPPLLVHFCLMKLPESFSPFDKVLIIRLVG